MKKKLPIIEQAIRVALVAHEGQVRKDDQSPYIVHPMMVGTLLARHGFSDEVIAAGITHDVLEDSDMGADEFEKVMGREVLAIVQGVSENTDLPWEERKQAYIDHLRTASEGSKAVSIADKIHNLTSLLAAYDVEGPALWDQFNRGKDKKYWFESTLLAMFQEEWDHPLVGEYATLVEKMRHLE